MAAAAALLALALPLAAADLANYLYFPSSDVQWVNVTIFPSQAALASNATALALACDATPSCVGFNLDGWLKNGSSSLAPQTVDLYLRAPSPPPPPPSPLWPQPRSAALGAGNLLLDPNTFAFSAPAPAPELTAAFARFSAIIFAHGAHDGAAAARARGGAAAFLPGLVVAVGDASIPLDVGVDESYTLDIPAPNSSQPAALAAPTVWGALQGLQTFAQLVGFDFDALAYFAPAPSRIVDAPKFAYRGVMVDPARQFLPPATLRAISDSLTVVKLNVLHVHILDCDSFPIQVAPPFERLWAGAFSPRERYSAVELAALAEFGRVRGVNVVYEFDQPGHMGAMCKGYPSLCPQPACSESYGGDVLDPSSPDTLPAMQAVVKALASATPGSVRLRGGRNTHRPREATAFAAHLRPARLHPFTLPRAPADAAPWRR